VALQRQQVQVPFGVAGLDTKTDSNSVTIPAVLTLENAIFTKPKRLSKRNGYSAFATSVGFPTTSFLTVGQAIAAYNNELLLADKGTLYSWSAADSTWFSKGSFSSANVAQSAIVRDAYQQTGQASAVHSSGLAAYAFEDTQGGSRYCVVDTSTGQLVVGKTLLVATAIKPRVVAFGNFLVVLYVNTSDARIYAAPIAISNPAATLVPVAISASSGNNQLNAASPNYDAAVVSTSSGPQLYVVYNDSKGGGETVAFYSTAATPTTFSAVTSLVTEACQAVTVFGDLYKQGPVFAYYNGTAVKFRAYDATLGTLYSAETVETVANVVSITGASVSSTAINLRLFYSVSAASTYNYFTKSTQITAYPGPANQQLGRMLLPVLPYLSPGDIFTAPSVFVRSMALAGKAFAYNGIAYVPLVYQSPLQPTYFVVDHSGNAVAKLLYSVGGAIPVRGDGKGAAMLTETNTLTSTSFQMALQAKDLLTTQSGQVYTQTGVESVTLNFFDPAYSYLRASIGQNFHLSGGFLSMYDGAGLVEHGFHLFPEPVSGVAAGAAGALSTGTYQGVAVYSWIDNQGQTHRSAPSVAASVTAVATNQITWTIPTLRLTAKQSTRAPVTVDLYRTVANGTTFYLDSSITSPTRNDTTADTVSFISTQADTAITGNPLLYTTGNVVENIAPNACSALVVHRNRLWALDPTNPLQWWYSKQILAPSVGVNTPPAEFSDLFVYNVDPRFGNVTAGASLDDKFIHFKASGIFATFGQGPDATGGQNDFSDAQLITTDVGCTNPRSIALVPDGLMFQSAKGIYLLDRALRVSYVGAAVEAYNSQTVTSAQLVPNTNQVRFTLSSGIALVYDYYMGQWSTFTNVNAVDAAIWMSQYVYLNPNGTAYQETPGTFSDAGNFIKLRVTTPWLQFGDVNGFQRLRRGIILGEYASPHSLLVSVAYDFNSAPTQTDTITPSSGASFGTDTPYGDVTTDATYGGAFERYQYLLHFAQQKCSAVQLTIEDSSTGTVGEGFSLSALTLEVGVKRGSVKLPATRQVG
jgi:hypothetical protein